MLTCVHLLFESSVISESSKTTISGVVVADVFESSVISESSKTLKKPIIQQARLRVVLFQRVVKLRR